MAEKQDMGVSIQVATYPITLLKSALFLQEVAEEMRRQDPPDHRNIPLPREAAAARAAITTAFNMVESLLIDLAQQCIADDKGTICEYCKSTITGQIRDAKGSISNTITEWPKMLRKPDTFDANLPKQPFEDIRQFRNHLTHPKLERLKESTPSQTELIKKCSAPNAKEIIFVLTQYAMRLYEVFGVAIPVEFKAVKK